MEGEIPHAILLSGATGSGKTTSARILKRHMKVSDHDFYELNCADFTGIDSVRKMISQMEFLPRTGKARIWLIDEAHGLSSEAQDAMLKPIEDPKEWVYVFFATTRADKIKDTLKNRCKKLEFQPLKPSDMTTLLGGILKKEGKKLDNEVFDRIREVAEGCPREAVQRLEQCLDLETKEAQLKFLYNNMKQQAYDLVKLLLYKKPSWEEVAKTISNIDQSNPERLRHFILACANTELLKGKIPKRAFLVISAFGPNWFDCPESGLAASCWEVVSSE